MTRGLPPSALALPGAALAEVLKPRLAPWLGPTAWRHWRRSLAEIPVANRLFLELHVTDPPRRCDIVSSVTVADGSLASWARAARGRRSAVWQQVRAVLRAWQSALVLGEGALWDDALMMWLEFDQLPNRRGLGDPSLFIALRPGADLPRLAGALGGFPALQAAVGRFAWDFVPCRPGLTDADLRLGHIGYMAARPSSGVALPLRSCWRMTGAAELPALLRAAGLTVDGAALDAALRRLAPLLALGNSLMLDLDSDDACHAAFAVEINLFERGLAPAARRAETVCRLLADLGFLTPGEAAALDTLTGAALAAQDRWSFCLLHHVKLRFSRFRIQDVKLYWLARVTDHQPRDAERPRLPPVRAAPADDARLAALPS